MAVDTAAKRFSMLNFGDGTTIHVLFPAAGDVLGDNDRLHMLDLYASGVAPPAPTANLASFNLTQYYLLRKWRREERR